MAVGEDSPGDYEEKLPADDTYVVQRGDTLAGVALRLGVKQSELKRVNHMYGSRTLVAGQVLRTSGPAKPADREEVGGHPSNARRNQCPGMDDAVSPRATPSSEVVVAEDGMVVEPRLEEIWFEQSRRDRAGPGAGAGAGGGADPSRAIGTAGSSSSLMPPIGETKPPLPPVLSPASGLLYEPPHWGGLADLGGGGSHSRQASDASSTASAAAAAGASVRDMFKYIRTKAAAVATTATAATYYGSENATAAATAAHGGAGAAAADYSISNLNYSRGGDGDAVNNNNNNNNNGGGGGSSTTSGVGGGSLPTTPGVPDVDEALPPAELWGGEREEAANATACATAQAAAREVSEAAQRSAREPSDDASNQSTAQTLLSMVRPSFWRTASSEGAGGGDEPAAVGGWGGGMGGSGGALGGESHGRGGSVGFVGGGSSVEERGGCPADEPGVGSLHTPALATAGGISPLAREAEAAQPPAPGPLKLPGLVCEGSTIVSHATLGRMDAAQPKHHRGYNWYLLFSTLRDGASYTTMYNRIKAEDPTFLIVESMEGEVFGGFATSAWASGCQYYGTGESFLFKIEGERVAAPSDDPDGNGDGDGDGDGDGGDNSDGGTATAKTLVDGEISAYGWTGMNMYLQYSDTEGMGMGGGGAEGSFGLFIGEDFLSGSTGRCDTYGNPPLCSEPQFQVSQVEVWGFTTADTEMGARLERLRKTLRGKTTRPL